ncbi:MAG: glycosyltransferase family 2 protein [Oscillospiraceae bacterium]|nr:glycosyltransferase family 2 protein [Oscillospiraceae bacterium]
MLLSIGMIVKNEEKYLEKCLTALKPILEKVDSELIIADTGSTDNTVEIAKKFTDKVYYFEWIDDFSAARNFTMEKSVGEWYMFLDADEVFQSCDEIISFFNSGEYKSYGSASYIVRSYFDEVDLSRYTDSNALRLTNRYSAVCFVNAIHEALCPVHSPVKKFSTVADHYGYFYSNNGEVTEQAYVKSKRNLEMLFKSLENQDVDFNAYREISDCYNIINNHEKALKYINMGLDNLDHSIIAITQYYNNKASLLISCYNDYPGVIETCNNYFGSDNPSHTQVLANDVNMYAMRGEAYFRTEQFNKAIYDFLQFFKVYKSYKSGKLNTDDLLYSAVKVGDRNLKNIYFMFFKSCVMTQKYNTAAEYLKAFPIEKYLDDKDYMLVHFRDRAEIMEHIGWKSIKKLVSTLDDNNRKLFFQVLRGKMFSSDKPEELLSVMSEFSEYVPCVDDAVEIYRGYFIDNVLQYEQAESFTKKYGAFGNTDILCMMLKCSMDISCFLTADDFKAGSFVHELYADFSEYACLLDEYDICMLSSDALVNAASLYGWAMVEALNSGKDITKLFEMFGKIAARWQSEFPNEENIPGDIRAGIIVHGITEARERKDYQTCISEMRRLIKVCPDFAPFVSEYRKVIESEAVQKKSVRSELAEMAAAVKKNIRSMIDAGDISTAESTLLELEKICPADPEIGILKYKLHNRK